MDIKIQSAKVHLMLDRPFYGSLIARLPLKDSNLDTFATDGQYIYCPKEHNFTFDELKFILAHEVLHCAFLHMFRRQNRDMTKWNISGDYVINNLLIQDRFTAPKGALINYEFNGKTTEEVYSLLPNPLTITLEMPDLIENKGSSNDDNKDKSSGTGKLLEELEQEWKETLANSFELNKGNLPSYLQEYFNSFLNPKVPWQQVLFRYLQVAKGQQDFVSYPFNRNHIYRKVYLPSLQGERIDINVAYDTSGSMSNEKLSYAMSEVRSICDIFGSYTINLIECDASIHNVIEITEESDLPEFVTGRGGTDFKPVFELINENGWNELPLIFFTDLMGDFPYIPKHDTFWIVSKEDIMNKVPFGKVIVMD